ncbi:PQQ-dependent sugar dehydrogenase [Alkalicoccobacillus porphyridii]|uniref:PQQ-dependent sugar dehydrogenase n=1 Tax=Alkalicoccobacillus porphyridii TaxID=2597270 RepID=A0A553ZUK0_9BACI|nr:PQQ-dependent sugar dehydrogenase [Alkalicoccobacillus porphyridii]TSB45112.1 PQQ-dependent sugar dehydrogenase [Alkalicoccobacillus porphyridii]
MRQWIVYGMAAGFLTACGTESENGNGGTNGDDSDASGVITDDNETDGEEGMTVIAESLDSPWAMQQINDEWLITERDGGFISIVNGEVTEQDLQLSDEVVQQGESGLLGFVLDPDFEDNQIAYMYYTYESTDGLANKVVQVSRDNDTWTEEEELIEGIPGAATHNGGRLAIHEGELYATTGDAEEPEWSQDTENLAGNILKMNLDGTLPDDMPFEDSYIWSYGHRNPQGLAWLDNGTMYSSEHGATALDEINLIEPGNNYGWPDYEGDETSNDTVAPVIHSGDDTWAPSGLAAHDDWLFMAGLRGEAVYQFDTEAENLEEYIEDYGRIRDVLVMDNNLYFLTNNTDGRGTPDDTDDKLIEVEIE